MSTVRAGVRVFSLDKMLGVAGGILLLGGLVGLVAFDRLPTLLATLLADEAASFGTAAVLGALLIGLAAFTTISWPVLRHRDQTVALGLAMVVWLTGMFLIDPSLTVLRVQSAAWLTNHPASLTPGLSLVVAAGALLATTFVIRPRGKPEAADARGKARKVPEKPGHSSQPPAGGARR